MGIAAYNRGSRCITRGLGLPVPGESTAKPEPRPEGWGDKAYTRAVGCARSVLSGAKRYGLTPPDEEVLVGIVQESARVGQETAARAVTAVLSE